MQKYKHPEQPDDPYGLFDDNSEKSITQQLLIYQTLSAQITSIGGLLQTEIDEEKKSILENKHILEVISIIGDKSVDPILLTAVCTFAYDLFETKELLENPKVVKPFYEAIKDLKELMPYLGVSNE